jgi:hypothetical protein
MTIDRRTFTVGATMAVVAPTLPLLPCQQPTASASPSRVVLMIHGWSISDKDSAGEEVWFRVDRSWRCAWR